MVPPRSKKQKTAADADAANFASLPRDVLGSILLRFPASDVRRFRRVCRDWRDAISDPVFIAAHMLHGPRAPTHSVVFYPGRVNGAAGQEPLNGGGFLFDEQWRLAARFAVDGSVDMIGTCKGLLCFRDKLQGEGVIRVVEPFAGDSIVLPLPPQGAPATCSARAYCFGFDAAATRRFKIVYVDFDAAATVSGAQEQELQVFTVGVDTDWRTVSFSCAVHGLSYDFPVCGDGAVYWHSKAAADGAITNVRFDLATENIASVRGQVDARRPEGAISCLPAHWLPWQCIIGIQWFGEWEDGCWPRNVTAVPHAVYVPAPHSPVAYGRRLPGPHALQRGRMLLQEKDGALRAQKIDGSSMSDLYVWFNVGSKQLIEIGTKEADPAERNQFVPVRGRHWPSKFEVGRLPHEQCDLSTFAYIPTVSPTPIAMYLGTSLQDLCKL
ncbi:hypothetical protein ACQ4PT_030610 [Festuca glaucescens]